MINCNHLDCPYWQEDNMPCEKLGETYFGDKYCGESLIESTKLKYNNKSKRTKRERDEKYSKKLKKLEKLNGYPTVVVYVDKKWDTELLKYIPVETPYYKRYYGGNGNHRCNKHKFYKKYSNKIIRKYKGEIPNGRSYKKLFDYWCAIY